MVALTPGLRSAEARPRHIVQFYDRDETLYSMVGDFLAEGMASQEPLVVIASQPHRDGFEVELRGRGLDPDLVLFLDARETLGQFMSGAMPDAQLFADRVGPLVAARADSQRRVRAYGEMVDLLWRDGNPEAAIRLEELWNDLGVQHGFSLFCAYPIGNFLKASDSGLFEHICESHSHVLPAGGSAGHDDERSRLIARLEQRTLALETEIQQRRDLEASLRDALAARRQTEEELRRLYEQAQDASRAKDQFLATVSHELRTPLTAILGWSRMMTLGILDEETSRTAIETIERSARAQASIIDDLLDLSKIVTGKLSLQPDLLDLNSIVDEAVQTCRLAAEAKQIDVVLHRNASLSVILGDPTRLRQIFWNLLANAVKYSPFGSRVAITLMRSDGEAVVKVSDNGRGIDPEFRQQLFQPFRQADPTSTRGEGGLGLGLAIVKHLTELHGGQVEVESAGLGHGATFTIRLPLVRSQQMIPAEAPPRIDLAGRRLIVVDDDRDTSEMVSVILTRFGASIETVDSMTEALLRLNGKGADLIVTDISMSDGDGFSLLNAVRADTRPTTPVIALTALSKPGTEERLRQAGFDAYLRKPIDPLDLARAVADLLSAGETRSS